MPFSPEEIQSRDFLVALRGYDKVEVETFLQEVASQYANLMEEMALLRTEATSESQPASDPFHDVGDQVASVMRAAADAAARLQTDTEQEVASIRANALDEASRAAAEARLELDAASELRSEAERQAAQLRSAAREEVAEIRSEARQILDAAKEARATAEREAKELLDSTRKREQELRTRAEQEVVQLIDSAKQEIEEAVMQVLLGCEGLQRAEKSSSSLTTAVSPDRQEDAEVPQDLHSGSHPGPEEDAVAS